MRRRTTGPGYAWGAQLDDAPNPLLRKSDRVQSTAKKTVTTLLILMLPVAVWIGLATMSAQQDRIAAQQISLHQTTATTTEAADATPAMQTEYSPTVNATVAAQWTDRGVSHQGTVSAPTGSPVGYTETIWVDAQGSRTGPPTTGADAWAASMFAAIGSFALVAGILIGAYFALRFRLDTHRHAQWDRELVALTA